MSTWRKLGMRIALAAWVLMPGWSAAANYRALLVGVSEYPNLDKSLQLGGPRNDVVRVRDVLVERGIDPRRITVLADGVPGAALPTRANILAQLDQLAGSARSGDYIVIHMAGHGSQQPVPPGSPFAAAEPDGLFEIFLPRDVGAWANLPGGQGGAVQNAIVDHEIRAAVDRMSAAGAFVWAIFDSCHSATLVRSNSGPGSEVRLRQVPPAALGIPLPAMDRVPARTSAPAAATASPKPGAGGSVFFYAAQSTEPTAELPLPFGHPQRVPRGLFTHTLMSALEGGAAMTYRQLAQQVLTQYGGIGEARATPLFSGTALDQPLLGQTALAVRQWRLSGDKDLILAAGALADVQEGAVFAILPSAIARTEEALGHASAARVELATAALVPVAHAGLPVRPLETLKAGRVARLVQPAMRFTLTVSADLGQCAQPCRFKGALEQLQTASKSGAAVSGAQIQWVAPGQASDVRLTAIDNKLWLMPPTMSGQDACAGLKGQAATTCQEQLERSLVSVTAQAQASGAHLNEAIGRALHAAARSANLMRIASTLGNAAASRQLKITVEIIAKSGKKSLYAAGQMPRLADGDKIRITLQNSGTSAIDVTALYLDSRYGVQVMFPAGLGASNRLEAAAASEPFVLDINDSTLGTERLAVIVVEAQKHGERADFSFLAQPTVSSEIVSRGNDASEAAALFLDAGFAQHTARGAKPAAPSGRTGMQVLSWQVVR